MILAIMEILLVVVVVQVLNTLVLVWSRRTLMASNLVLRQQLTVFKRKRPRPALRDRDRLFWLLISRVWMELGTRRVVHFNVTEHPTQAWVKQQIRNATFEEQPKFLTHDNDGIFGQFGRPVTAEVNGKKVSCRSSFDLWLAQTLGIRGIPTPYRAPNAAVHIERFMGTLRREVLDRILVWNQGQLRAVLEEYIHGWYNNSRVHQGIHGIPEPDPELSAPKPANGRLAA